MKEFFEYIKQHILSTMPRYKTVELYNNQIFQSNVERSEKAFPYPAVFIEMIVGEMHNRALGINDTEMNLVFHFALEGYKFNHGEDMLTVLSEFDYNVRRIRSSEGPYFSTFQSQGILYDTDNNNVVEPTMTYTTMWRQQTGYHPPIEKELEDIEVNGEII
jgi:hypothetical protein